MAKAKPPEYGMEWSSPPVVESSRSTSEQSLGIAPSRTGNGLGRADLDQGNGAPRGPGEGQVCMGPSRLACGWTRR